MRRVLFFVLSGMLTLFLTQAQCPAGEPIKVGAMFNETGGMSSIDAPGLKGARLKVRMINEAGGLLGGRPVELIAMDSQTEPELAVTGAKKLLGDGVIAGLGFGDTTYVLAAGPRFQARGVPFVTSGATFPDLPAKVGSFLFLAAFGDDDQARAVAEFGYNKLNLKRLAIWTDRSMDFTQALSRFFMARFKALGGAILEEDFFKSGDKDFAAQIARLKAADPKPDGIFVSAGPDEAGRCVKVIREAGLELPILSGDGFDTELVATVPGPKLANGVYFSTHAFRGDHRPEVLKFIEAYYADYGVPPENAFAALGFDAMGLIASAIEKAGSLDGEAIREALAATKDYPGVTGAIGYVGQDRVPRKPVAIVNLQQGEFHVAETWTPQN